MARRTITTLLLWLVVLPGGTALATAPGFDSPPETPPPSTLNVFYPEERALSDCLSAVPKPGCGSEARGGWRQTTIFGLIIGAFAFIIWRIVRSARANTATNRQAADR